MRAAKAIQLAKDYANQYAVPWRRVVRLNWEREWYVLGIRHYDLTVDTGDGAAEVTVSHKLYNDLGIHRFEYFPTDPAKMLLPLWAAFPGFTSVTIGWRMSYGEAYKYRWHAWYRGLDDPAKVAYRQQYPSPDGDGRHWDGFYEEIADAPSDGGIGDLIVGRV